jgi:Fe-S cluster assembly protein SufD
MTDLQPYLAAFASRPRGADNATRRAAIARFGALGLPTRRQENWRFTNLRPLEKTFFPPAGPSKMPASIAVPAPYVLGIPSHRLVLVNGRFAPELSETGALPPSVSLLPVAELLEAAPSELRGMVDEQSAHANNPFLALNTALFEDGFALSVSDGVAVERIIEIVHLGRAEAPLSAHTRNQIHLSAGSTCTIIETFAGTGPYWVNDAIEIDIAAGATLRHVVLQDDAAPAIHLSHRRIGLAKRARYEAFTLTLGAGLSRQDTHVAIEGESAHCAVNGAYLLRRNQESTIATLIDHAAPSSETREVFKGVIDDRAHGAFQGKIQVRQAAQKTNAHQLNRNLLLSPRAAVDTKPELEIYADDVKCSHGATVGDLDEAALFYLISRGLPAIEARRMLIEAFAADALDLVTDAGAKAYLRRHLDRWLANHRG